MVGLGVTLSVQGTQVGRHWKLRARDSHAARGVRQLGSQERMSSESFGGVQFPLSQEKLEVERL